jgi:truncated hemoglobin YjbI
VPASDLAIRPPQPMDLLTPSYFCEAEALSDGRVQVVLEPQRSLRYRTGQMIHVVTGEPVECVLTLVSDPERDFVVTAMADAHTAQRLPAWMRPGAEFGHEFELRGPFDERLPDELAYPEPDPGLWELLDQGRVARAVFEDFYAKVYADPRLAPFFANVTMDRSIDKQFSFFKQCVTGEKIYMGDRPRNAHHWMIISHELFDHRQHLMRETLLAHGLDEAGIARWTRFEEYFRPDIVKTSQWPRQIGGELVMNDGFAHEVLGEASLCDHCGAEIDAGSTVLYHRRLGTIACNACAAHGMAVQA